MQFPNDTLKSREITKEEIKEFDINRFQLEADSLLKVLKDEKYSLELKSDTFNFKSDILKPSQRTRDFLATLSRQYGKNCSTLSF